MQKIIPFLWFDKNANEIIEFYKSVFKDLKIKNKTELHNTPSGDTEIITVNIFGQQFTIMTAGPIFKFNPSISFLIQSNDKNEINNYYEKLSHNGTILMELNEYPFSEKYAWIQDKYDVSWQIMFTKNKIKQKIIPKFMFVQEQCGKAEEAIISYTTIFKKSKINAIMRYTQNETPDKEGTIKHGLFTLENQEFSAMDSAYKHNFKFNEAISFVVNCKNQEEIDYYWEQLSAEPQAEQCGWLKDKYGISWQVVPNILNKLLQDKNTKKVEHITKTFLNMKKFDIEKLKAAYRMG